MLAASAIPILEILRWDPFPQAGSPRSDKYHNIETRRSLLHHRWYLALVLLVTVVQKTAIDGVALYNRLLVAVRWFVTEG
jgi:hypothetical protein